MVTIGRILKLSGSKSSARKKIETLTDDSGNSFSSHAGKVKILKSHYRKLGTELDVKSFDD